jgi:hypothetical protein
MHRQRKNQHHRKNSQGFHAKISGKKFHGSTSCSPSFVFAGSATTSVTIA